MPAAVYSTDPTPSVEDSHISKALAGEMRGLNRIVAELPPDLPVAQLQTISLKNLLGGDAAESAKLFEAAKKDGFFYLDVQHFNEMGIQDTIEDMYALAEELFGLEEAEKFAYDVDNLGKMKLNGYKPMGRNFGGIGGKRDGFESYAIPKDGVMGLGDAASFPRPPVIDQYMETLKDLMNAVHVCTAAIFSSLSASLGLPPQQGFENFHRPGVTSPDVLRLLKYHAQSIQERGAPQTPHTDLGSLTVLFTRQPGLQVLPPGAEDWAYVAPRPGHAIINLGDQMSLLTNKLFLTCLHRVAPLPDRAMETRYSFAYLMRAEDDTPLTGMKSDLIPPSDSIEEVLTSGEWLGQKFGMLRFDTYKEKQEWILTGRKQTVPR